MRHQHRTSFLATDASHVPSSLQKDSPRFRRPLAREVSDRELGEALLVLLAVVVETAPVLAERPALEMIETLLRVRDLFVCALVSPGAELY